MTKNIKNIIECIIALFIFTLAFWGIHYTSDWAAYLYFFEHPESSRDFFFGLMAEYFNGENYTFEMLYRFYISMIALAYVYLFNRIKANPIILVLILIVFNYVAMGNQIRFYLAFPCCLLAFYKILEKKYVFALILLIASVLNHKTSILLFSVLIVFNCFAYKMNSNKQITLIILLNIIFYVLLNYISLFDEKYNEYNTANQLSSFLGGIFNVFPFLFPIYFIYRINKINRKRIIRHNSIIYRFLYVCSIAPTVFLLSGVYVQILTNRFVIAFLPIWFGYFMFAKKYLIIESVSSKAMIFTTILISVWTFLLRPLLGFNEYFQEIALMLYSYNI